MLGWRLFSAAALIVPLLAVIWLDDQFNAGRPGIWLCPIAVIVGVMGCQEVNWLLSRKGLAVSRTPNLLATFSVLFVSLAPLLWIEYPVDCVIGKPGWSLLGMALAVAIIFTAELIRYREPGESLTRLATGLFATVYSGLLLSFLIQLRFLHDGRVGLVAVIATILIVKLSDSGAYFVGRAIGKNKLAPHLSPGKTIEGFCGGILFAMGGAWAVHSWLLPTFVPDTSVGSLLWFLIYGVTLAIAGVLGDLSESLMKREAGEKDSSRWLRGLGGVLDVIDSMLSTAPVSFAWWASGLLAVS